MNANKSRKAQYWNVIPALAAGVATGLAVSLLTARKPGKELRAGIGAAVDDCLDSARGEASHVRNAAAKIAARGVKEVRKTADKAIDLVGDTVSDAVDARAQDAHGVIDKTVAAMRSGAEKGHQAVDHVADAVRSRVPGHAA